MNNPSQAQPRTLSTYLTFCNLEPLESFPVPRVSIDTKWAIDHAKQESSKSRIRTNLVGTICAVQLGSVEKTKLLTVTIYNYPNNVFCMQIGLKLETGIDHQNQFQDVLGKDQHMGVTGKVMMGSFKRRLHLFLERIHCFQFK